MTDEIVRSVESPAEAQRSELGPVAEVVHPSLGVQGRGPDMDDEEEKGGLDLGRYRAAAFRRPWILVLGVLVGGFGAYKSFAGATRIYAVEGSLWIEDDPGQGAGSVAPIRLGAVLRSNGWVELLKSYIVIDPVVIQERLYLEAPTIFEPAFAGLRLSDRFAPGTYDLRVSAEGTLITLAMADGPDVDSGAPGDSLGREQGLLWAPTLEYLSPGDEVRFRLLVPRDAARGLLANIQSRMDQQGNFIRLSLTGQDPERIARILQAVMVKHVEVAADIKRTQLDSSRVTLERQLTYTEEELRTAERDLEEFRIRTITLPPDEATPVAPGLTLTTGTAFSSFFSRRLEVEQLRRDRLRLTAVLDSIRLTGTVKLEALEVIPVVGGSSEMKAVINELVTIRNQLRVLRDRYEDTYPPVQELLTRMETIEVRTIPQLTEALLRQTELEERQLGALLESAAVEMSAIPARTMEEARLTRRVTIAVTLYNQLRTRVETARLASASSVPDVRILDNVAVPQFPTGDNRVTSALTILLGALAAALGIAILWDRFDSKFQYPTEVAQAIGLETLGSIPRIRTDAGEAGKVNAAQVIEAFRDLRLNLQFAYGSAGPMLLTISSPSQGEGKSLISANLAVAFAGVGRRTLLIDADTRRGDVHRLLGVERTPGLTDYLRDRANGDIIQRTEYASLDFIGSGTRGESTPELLASARMSTFLGTLKRAYEVVIIDSPPLAAGGDPYLLAALTGNLALVIRNGSTEKALALSKLQAMSRFPVRILGAILNDVDPKLGNGYYYLTDYAARAEVEGESEGGAPLLASVQAPSGDS